MTYDPSILHWQWSKLITQKWLQSNSNQEVIEQTFPLCCQTYLLGNILISLFFFWIFIFFLKYSYCNAVFYYHNFLSFWNHCSSSCVDLTSTSRLLAVKENIKPRDSNTSLGSQIFSPLRGPDSLENLSFGASAVKTPVMMNHQHSSSHHSNSRFSTESLFSPLR